jgi:SPP1 family predicted phage head-tail adaptor
VRPGTLVKRVTFQRRDETQDAFGTEDANIWTDVFECSARIAMSGGREFQKAQLILATLEKLFVVRYCSELSDVTEKDRISYGGDVYDIGAVTNVMERNRELQFLCTLHR